jgi:hypothetical protein
VEGLVERDGDDEPWDGKRDSFCGRYLLWQRD